MVNAWLCLLYAIVFFVSGFYANSYLREEYGVEIDLKGIVKEAKKAGPSASKKSASSKKSSSKRSSSKRRGASTSKASSSKRGGSRKGSKKSSSSKRRSSSLPPPKKQIPTPKAIGSVAA
uniref:Candidate secreted effector n=1 Tax=Meloidogyne incognita TaxID=6306 RepID=A0A914L510_MELIC